MNTQDDCKRQVVFENSAPCNTSLADVDLDAVRRAFCTLMDEAAHANTLAGFDLDDVLVERQVACSAAGMPETIVAADHLSDCERFSHHMLNAVRPTADEGQPPACSNEDVKIVRLIVTVIRETRLSREGAG